MTKEEFEKQTGYLLTERNGELYYDEYLDLCDSEIKSLPDNLTVNGDLNLIFTPIESLPDNLTVNGDLILYRSKIKSLPNNLNVNGDLDLSVTSIKSLPNNLTVNDHIIITNENIKYNIPKIGFLFSKKIGSRCSITCYNIKKDLIKCGCFQGSLNEFIDQVYESYSDLNNQYRIEYDQFIKECKYYKRKITIIKLKTK